MRQIWVQPGLLQAVLCRSRYVHLEHEAFRLFKQQFAMKRRPVYILSSTSILNAQARTLTSSVMRGQRRHQSRQTRTGAQRVCSNVTVSKTCCQKTLRNSAANAVFGDSIQRTLIGKQETKMRENTRQRKRKGYSVRRKERSRKIT